MPGQEGITIGLMTPRGPLLVGFSPKNFVKFVEMVNAIFEKRIAKTPIPKVWTDAFEKEEDNANTD